MSFWIAFTLMRYVKGRKETSETLFGGMCWKPLLRIHIHSFLCLFLVEFACVFMLFSSFVVFSITYIHLDWLPSFLLLSPWKLHSPERILVSWRHQGMHLIRCTFSALMRLRSSFVLCHYKTLRSFYSGTFEHISSLPLLHPILIEMRIVLLSLCRSRLMDPICCVFSCDSICYYSACVHISCLFKYVRRLSSGSLLVK